MNPYLRAYHEAAKQSWLHQYGARKHFVHQYAWAIPNDEAIAALVKLSPLVELGAGTGYWAKLIREAGGHVMAYDRKQCTHGMERGKWSPVLPCTSARSKAKKATNLFFCWPYMASWCDRALDAFQGEHVAYIGEGWHGCTATDRFHGLLDERFTQIEWIEIPQWDGLHDALYIYRRR